jgi:glycosyltransferase involved in cell wall biosynthesis
MYYDGIEVYHFNNLNNSLANRKFAFAPNMFFTLRRDIERFDLIHIHEYYSLHFLFASYWARKSNIPYIVQPHGSLPNTIGKKNFKILFDYIFGNKILKNANALIALNAMEAQQYKSMGLESNKVYIIPNSIDVNKYRDIKIKDNFRTQYSIEKTDKIILFMGRLHKIKSVDLLINAFARLSKKYSRLKLVIAGPDDGELKHLLKLIHDLDIEKDVIMTGLLTGDDKILAYVNADIFVLPSIYDAFPTTILESCACGTPVIVTKNCGLAEFANSVGFVINHNEYELERVLNDYLFQSSIIFDKEEIIKKTQNKYDINRIVDMLELVYNGICQDRIPCRRAVPTKDENGYE